MAKTVKVEFDVDNSDLDKSIKKVDDLKKDARIIPSEVIVDSSDIDETEDKLDSLKDDAQTISSKIDVDDKSLKSTTVSVNQLKKDAKTVSSKVDVDTSLLDGAKNEIKDIKDEAKKPVQIVFNAETGEVDILSEKTLNLRQQVKLLKEQLLTVPEGTAEWQAINARFNDAQDAIDRVNVKSRDLFGTLQLIPGPIGEISNTLDTGINSFKVFASLKADDLKANIKGVIGDFKEIATTIGKATGITRVYTSINTALATSFKVTEASSKSAAIGIKVFSGALVATGVGALVVGLGLAAEALYKFATASGEAEEAQRLLDAQIRRTKESLDDEIQNIKDATDKELLQAQKRKATAAELQKIREDGLKKQIAADEKAVSDKGKFARLELEISLNTALTEEERKKKIDENDANRRAAKRRIIENNVALDKLVLQGEVDAIVAADAEKDKLNQKRQEKAKETAQTRKEELTTIKKNQEDAILTLMDQQTREEEIIKNKYKEQIALAIKNGADTRDIVDAREKELLDLRAKYQQEFNNKEKDFQDKLKSTKEEYDNKELERIKLVYGEFSNQYIKARQTILDSQKSEIDSQIDALQKKKNLTNEEILLLQDLQTKKVELGNQQMEFNNGINDHEKEIHQQRLDRAREREEEEVRINNVIVSSWIELGNNIGNTFGQLAGVFKEGSDLQKSFAIVSVLVNAASAAGKVFMDSADSMASYTKAKDAGLAGLASAAVNLSNPVTAAIGAAQLITSKAAIAAATAGMAKVKINKGLQLGAIGASSAAQIAAIMSADKNKSASKEGSDATPSFSQPSVPVPNVGQSQSQTGTLATIVNSAIQRDNSKDRPIRTYVVQNDIRTEEQLNRRVRTAARLG